MTPEDWDDLVAAMQHFLWLDDVGALSREESQSCDTFRRILEEYGV